MNDDGWADGVQASPRGAQDLRTQLLRFLWPLLSELDERVDRRLVRTLWQSIEALIRWRNRAHGLLLSELGGYLLSPGQAPAGTKRLSNLLRSPKWTAEVIERFIWRLAEQRLCALEQASEDALVVWDESVLEKPESIAAPDWCAVRSSKGRRLTRIKPGYYRPPSRPLFVPGLQWIGLLVVGTRGESGPPTVATMRWWTSRGPRTSDLRSEEQALLADCGQRWGARVCHVWDRGFAGSPWLRQVLAQPTTQPLRWVVRWPGRYKLAAPAADAPLPRKAWEWARGKRSWEHRLVWDARRHVERKVGVLAIPVRHPDAPTQPLWLVVARRGQGQEPWYLLTNQPVVTVEDAWLAVYRYARRWQIELTWRYGKSELAMESPRVWTWERRHKLLLLATLAYAFLLTLLTVAQTPLRTWLLRCWCHRTGKRCQAAAAPLYRLRSALSRLWQAFPALAPPFLPQTPG